MELTGFRPDKHTLSLGGASHALEATVTEPLAALLGAERHEAKAWEDARRIRGYVKAMKSVGGKDTPSAEWALGVADRLDPSKTKA